MNERVDEGRFPASLEHQHGLAEWWPMLPERSTETIVPGEGIDERMYRCQAVGCGHLVKLAAASLGTAPEPADRT